MKTRGISVLTILLLSAPALADEPLRTDVFPQEGMVVVEGGELFYRTAGSGPAVVLLHGYSLASVVWLPYFEKLAEDHLVIAFDLPGHGRSDRLGADFSHARAAAAVLEGLSALDVDEFHVIGHSSGGLIALHMALAAPEKLLSLVAVDTPWRIPEAAREAGARMSIEDASPAMLDQLKQWHPGGIAQIRWIMEQQARLAGDPSEMAMAPDELRSIAAPTLVVHGNDDAILPVETAIELSRIIPNAGLLVLPDARHEFILYRSNASELFEMELSHFLH